MDISADARAAFDAEVTNTCEREGWPSVTAAAVIGGEWWHGASAGSLVGVDGADLGAPSRDTVYRIASMTKSFTAAVVLGLRDDGALRLDDPVAQYVPELANLRAPSSDSPAITLRHLLTMSAGMSTDDKWGDRQLDVDAATLDGWFHDGSTFAHTTGVAMEYSNYGYAMLGRVIENVTGTPYDQVVTERLLRPLGMSCTAFRRADLPAGSAIARSYHRVGHDNVADESGHLEHGGFGAMGGLWSTIADLATWVHFLGDGFPSRGGEDEGPLSRASRREMQQVHRAYEPPEVHLHADGKIRMIEVGYGMGLEIFSHSTLGKIVTHSGGLPGYGSNMRWSIDRGIGVITLANVTYAHARALADRLLDLLVAHDAIPPAPRRSAPLLEEFAAGLVAQLNDWSNEPPAGLFASNVDLDEPFERRRTAAAALIAEHGPLTLGRITPMSATEGDGVLTSADGTAFTLEMQLTPTVPSFVQWYRIVENPPKVPESTPSA